MRQHDLVEFLRRYGASTTFQIARHLGTRPDTVEALCRLLCDEGKICRHGLYWLHVFKGEQKQRND